MLEQDKFQRRPGIDRSIEQILFLCATLEFLAERLVQNASKDYAIICEELAKELLPSEKLPTAGDKKNGRALLIDGILRRATSLIDSSASEWPKPQGVKWTPLEVLIEQEEESAKTAAGKALHRDRAPRNVQFSDVSVNKLTALPDDAVVSVTVDEGSSLDVAAIVYQKRQQFVEYGNVHSHC